VNGVTIIYKSEIAQNGRYNGFAAIGAEEYVFNSLSLISNRT